MKRSGTRSWAARGSRKRQKTSGGLVKWAKPARKKRGVLNSSKKSRRRVKVFPKLREAIKKIEDAEHETKFNLVPISIAGVTGTTPDVTTIVGQMASGTTNITRIGESVNLKYLMLDLIISNTVAFAMYFRISVFKTNTLKSVAWTGGELFLQNPLGDTLSYNGATASFPWAGITYKMARKAGYTPVYSKVVKLGIAGDTRGTYIRKMKVWIPLKNQEIKYEGAGVGVGLQNHFYYVMFTAYCPGQLLSAAVYNVTGEAMLTYKDA